MTKIITTTVYLSLILGFIGMTNNLTAQEEKERKWSKHVASPSYGLSLAFLNVEYQDRNDNEQSEGLVMPGLDFRHFNGVNVSEGGGFYYGYELGMGLNFNTGGQSYSVSSGDNEYELENVLAYRFFLMGKHGYRFNLSDNPDGFSLGLELGLGIVGGGADVTLRDLQSENQSSYSGGSAGASPIVDVGLEGAFQVKESKRLTIRLALTIGNSFLETEYGEVVPASIRTNMPPAFLNLRFGFRMFHNK